MDPATLALLGLLLMPAGQGASPVPFSPRALPPPPDAIELELRVFDGSLEVTAETTVRVFATGQRDRGAGARRRPGRVGLVVAVQPGIYDAQANQQRGGRVVKVRWAERLTVMAYPDEAGRHLAVLNFNATFGALQLRRPAGCRRPSMAGMLQCSRPATARERSRRPPTAATTP